MKTFGSVRQQAATVSFGLAVLFAGLVGAGNLRAEGSKELCANGGYRPWLMYRNDTSDGSPITNRTVISVYAKTNETINLGSSVRTASKIIWYAPNGVIGTNAITGGVGIISNRTQEVAGPFPNVGGYNPRTITVSGAQTGVWEIHFISPDPTSADNPSSVVATNNWTQPTSGGQVAAWDVTVRTSGGVAIPGRVFANLISMNIGDWVNGGALRSQVYYLTADGYRYRINLNSVDPYRFQFFANNRGFRNGSGAPLFKSVTLAGASVHNPLAPDTATNVTHKMFFSTPAGDLPASAATRSGTTWLSSTPTTVITSNIRFVGLDGTTNQVGSALGGNFTFDATGPGSYIINIDLNSDGAYTSAVDRVLLGTAYAGTNTVFWDGRDGQGNPAPGGQSIFNSRVAVANGEVHFPFADAEGCYNGIVIERLNGPTNDAFTIYWDDTNFTGGTSALPPTGSNSVAGAHSWLPSGNTGFGNARGIDTWVFVPGDFEQPSSPIVIKQTDLELVSQTRTPGFVKPNTNVTYTTVIRNNGPDNTPQARLLAVLPPGLTNVTLFASSFSGGAGITSSTFSNNIYDARVHMNVGEVGTLTFHGTVAAGLGSILTNVSRFLTYDDVGDVNDPDRVGAGNNGNTNIVAVTFSVAGTVYSDVNINSTLDGAETGTGLGSLYAKLINTNSPAVATQAALVDPTTGAYTLTTTTTGGFVVILDDNSTLADVTPALPAGWLGTEAVGQRRTGVTVINDVSGINFGLHNSSYLLLSTLANPTVRTTAGSITLSVTVTNTSSISNALTAFVNNLPNVPGAATYVAGTSAYNGTGIGNPTIVSVTNLTWSGTFAVPAGGVGTLTFAINLPATLGVYTNRTFARVSNTQIDTTASTADNAPAIETARRSATPNNAPTVQNVITSVNMGTNVVINPSAADADGDPLTLFIVTPPAHGSVLVNPNLTFTYTPLITYFGPDSFTYRATDGTSNSVLGTASISVLDVIPPQISQGPTNQIAEAGPGCQAAVPNFTAGVTATDNTGASPTITQNPLVGALANFGTNNILVIATDGSANTATSTAQFVVLDTTAPNISQCAAPVVVNTGAGTNIATSVNLGAGPVATDFCGLGTITSNAPAFFALGSNTVTWTVSDTHGNIATCQQSVVVLDAEAPLLACPGNIVTNLPAGQCSFTVLALGMPVISDNVGIATVVSNAPAVFNIGTTQVVWTVTDTSGNSAVCTQSVTVLDVTPPQITTLPVNPTGAVTTNCQAVVPDLTGAVVATDDCTTSNNLVIVQSPLAGTLADLGGNPITFTVTDASGNSTNGAVTFTVTDETLPTISCPAPMIVVAPAGTNAVGNLSLGTPVTADNCGVGSVTNNAPGLFLVGDTPVIWTVTDDSGNTATCTQIVSVLAINHAPVANADSYTNSQNSALLVTAPGLLANDSDPDGDPIFAVIVAPPTNGLVTVNADGSFMYTPNLNFVGTDSFSYKATDGNLNSSNAVISIVVEPVNQAATANPDSFSTPSNTTLTVTAPGVLANDTDPEDSALTAVLVNNVTHGTLTLNPDGSFEYIPTTGYIGFDYFTYAANDGDTDSAPVLVTLAVGLGDVPVANPDSYTLAQNDSLTVALVDGVLANDTSVNPLTAFLVSGPQHGTLQFNADGTFTYTPTPNYSGTDSFVYRATAGTLVSSAAIVTFTVNFIDQPPFANPDSYSATPDGVLTVDALTGVLANDYDPEGLPVTAALVDDVTDGVLVFNPDGSFQYTPDTSFVGTDSFTYFATDGVTNSGPVTVTIYVDANNRVPVANNDSFATNKNAPLNVPAPGVLANDYDEDGNALTAALVTGPAHGALTFNADGSFIYTPTNGFSGADSFTYKLSDGAADSSVANVFLTINNVILTPTVQSSTPTVGSNGTLVMPAPGALTGAVAPNGLALTALLVTNVANGTLVLNPDGSYSYTPDANFLGADCFTFAATDGLATSAVATVCITVVDTTPPVISACAPGQAASAGPTCQAVVPDFTGNLTVSDNSGAAPTITQSPLPAVTLPLGTNTITLIATDGAGNTATCTTTFVVNDTTAPVITLTGPNPLTVECHGSFNDPGATAADNCAGSVTGSILVTGTVNADAVGSYTVHYNVTDPAGNAAGEVTRTVHVVDTTAPALTCPTDIIVTAPRGSNSISQVSLGTPTASDDCGTVAVSNDALSSFPLGDTIVTWTVHDGNGNTNTCQQTVTVLFDDSNNVPVATDATFETSVSGTMEIAEPGLLLFASDADDDELTALKITEPAHGALELNPDGSFSYTPESGFQGTDTFTYAVSDGLAQSAPATVTIIVSLSGAVTDEELYAKAMSFTLNRARGQKDRFRITGKINPRGSRTELAGTTVVLNLNGAGLSAPVVLDAKGKGQLVTGGARLKVRLNSATGRYRVQVSRADLSQAFALPSEGNGLAPVEVELVITFADLEVTPVMAVLETPYKGKAGKLSRGRFKFKKHRTLTGVFSVIRTTAKQLKDGNFKVTGKGVIENVGGSNVAPEAPVRLIIGTDVLVIPGSSLKAKLVGTKRFFKFNAKSLPGTGLPAAANGGVTAHKVPIVLEVPTADGTNVFETIIELKRRDGTATKWSR